MIKKILEYSYKHNLGHIPSALSMIGYLKSVFKYINRNDIIIIGKPFGAQAYYVLWEELGWLDNIDGLHMGVKHEEIDFVHYSEETIGNALGVAAGVSLTTDKKIYVNISDACLQMGPTLEAIQFIGKNGGNILVTVDYNNSQVTGKCSDIIPVNPVIDFFRSNDWNVYESDGTCSKEADIILNKAYKLDEPTVIFFKTEKGYGIERMKGNEWHYKKIESEMELQSLVEELQVI